MPARSLLILVLAILPTSIAAESVVAARVIRARTLIGPEDLLVVDRVLPGALVLPEDAEGLEARKTIYPGRPVRAEDLAPPAAVERNQRVILAFTAGALTIETEGRALDRAAVGDTVRVMNAGSRAVLSGVVSSDSKIRILPGT